MRRKESVWQKVWERRYKGRKQGHVCSSLCLNVRERRRDSTTDRELVCVPVSLHYRCLPHGSNVAQSHVCECRYVWVRRHDETTNYNISVLHTQADVFPIMWCQITNMLVITQSDSGCTHKPAASLRTETLFYSGSSWSKCSISTQTTPRSISLLQLMIWGLSTA